jgi:hypothetical protein
MTTGLFSWEQTNKSTPKTFVFETSNPVKNVQTDKNIYTKSIYINSNGKRVIIENSFPKGGTKYIELDGKESSYAVFFTHITNETDTALELKIDIPQNSYEISNFPGKYFELLSPADTMTLDEISLGSYGLTDIKSFLDNSIHKQSSYKRTINPKESSGFYFIMFIRTLEATGTTRTALSLKGQDLFYQISRYSKTTLIDEKEIYCGSINLKNLRLQK